MSEKDFENTFERIKFALISQNFETARDAYSSLQTAENAQEFIKYMHVRGSHIVKSFLLNNKIRNSAETPFELRDINYQKLFDKMEKAARDDAELRAEKSLVEVPQSSLLRKLHRMSLTNPQNLGIIKE